MSEVENIYNLPGTGRARYNPERGTITLLGDEPILPMKDLTPEQAAETPAAKDFFAYLKDFTAKKINRRDFLIGAGAATAILAGGIESAAKNIKKIQEGSVRGSLLKFPRPEKTKLLSFEETVEILKKHDPLMTAADFFAENKKQVSEQTEKFKADSKKIKNLESRKSHAEKYAPIIFDYCRKYGVPYPVATGVFATEFGVGNYDTSERGARGFFQILPGTFQRLGFEKEDVGDPEKNIEAGVKYLALLGKKYNNAWDLAVFAYHQGDINTNGLIKKYQAKNYWELRPHLSDKFHKEGKDYPLRAAAYAKLILNL